MALSLLQVIRTNDVEGSGEVYHCLSCALKIDRDCNGARNIFIKNISVND